MAETELKFIEFLNVSHYSNTWCVIPDLQHKRQPLCEKYRCLFHSWWMVMEAMQPFQAAFLILQLSRYSPEHQSSLPAAPLSIPVTSHSDQPRAEVVTQVWGAQDVFQLLWHCSMKLSFAKLMAGIGHCCMKNFEMFFPYILLYKMVPGWKILYAPWW